MKIAVEGCAHGELDMIYQRIAEEESRGRFKVDLLICCGDFQSVRNAADLACMAVPEKYKEMCSFYRYYSGEKTAPILTIFIGGNHEASNYLQELPYGGWVAPNIYYLGYAGVVQYKGLRIAGLSGIYKGPDYLKGRYEIPPYDHGTIRSVYHVRNLDVFRLRQLTGKVDVMITHDWPRGIYNYGDKETLLRYKTFFRDEVERNILGSRAGELLLQDVRPCHWFAAHLHVRFTATVQHKQENEKPAGTTKFLALDKCLPKRKFLEILDLQETNLEAGLEYDPQWLSILKSTNHLLSVENLTQHMPGPGYSGRWDFRPTEEELSEIREKFNLDFRIPKSFSRTGPVFDGNKRLFGRIPGPLENSQTKQFCEKLGVDDPIQLILSKRTPSKKKWNSSFVNEAELDVTVVGAADLAEISISLDSEDSGTPGLFFVDKQGFTPVSTPQRPVGPFASSTPTYRMQRLFPSPKLNQKIDSLTRTLAKKGRNIADEES